MKKEDKTKDKNTNKTTKTSSKSKASNKSSSVKPKQSVKKQEKVQKKSKTNNIKNNINVSDKPKDVAAKIEQNEIIESLFEKPDSSNESVLSNPKPKFYVGYYTRVVIRGFLGAFFLMLGFILLYFSFKYNPEKIVNYDEKSDIDYQVYLKPNNFFETPYLGKGMNYIASLIDHLDVSFDYKFNIDEKVSMNFIYDIVGKLTIEDDDGTIFYEKDYVLLDEKTGSIVDSDNYSIHEQVTIDYGHYNNLASGFKNSYGINAVSKLKVYLNLKKKSAEDSVAIDINEGNNISLSIPLSVRSINIALDQNAINNSNKLIKKAQIVMDSKEKLICSIISFILAIIFIVKMILLLTKTRTKSSSYDKYVKKLLVEYDRLIVETTYCPSFKDFEVIKIDDFQELLDVRDNLKLPIMYYNVKTHHKCYLYILNNSILYLVTIKAVDLEKNNM